MTHGVQFPPFVLYVGQYEYFQLVVSEKSPLTVSVTAFSGDPDIVMAHTENPTTALCTTDSTARCAMSYREDRYVCIRMDQQLLVYLIAQYSAGF